MLHGNGPCWPQAQGHLRDTVGKHGKTSAVYDLSCSGLFKCDCLVMSCHYHLFLFLLPDLHYVSHMKPARVNSQITNSSTLNTFGADFGQLSFQEQTTSRQAIMKYITSAVTQVQYGIMVSQFQNVSKHVITGLTSSTSVSLQKGWEQCVSWLKHLGASSKGTSLQALQCEAILSGLDQLNGQSESSKSVRALSICHNLTQSVTTGHSQSDIPESSSWFRLGRALPYPGDGKIKVGNTATLSRAAAILPLNSLNSSTLCSEDQDGPGLQSKPKRTAHPLTFVD